MSSETFRERPQRKEATVKTTKPRTNTVCPPYRSPILPKTSERPAVDSEYAITAQEIPMMSVPRLLARVGSEMANILMATPERKAESITLVRRVQLSRESEEFAMY